MKWVDSTDIIHWADTRDCQGALPELIRRLIRATVISINKINFPSGENVQLEGWDGILELADGTEYIPRGISAWEFGASKPVKKKADSDYEKRTQDALGIDPSGSTYVFVTPRRWKGAAGWVKNRMSEKVWKEIRVIDAVILEEWLEIAPAVALWFASEHLHKVPEKAVMAAEHFWSEWSQGEDKTLNPDLLLAGREKERTQLQNVYCRPGLLALKSPSKEETLAFIIGSFLGTAQAEDFFARSVVVDDTDSFRKLCAVKNPLILLPRFEDNSLFNAAVRQGHTVIVPLGIDDPDLWKEVSTLPEINRDGFVAALVKMGYRETIAQQYARESARNLMVLRRQLGFNHMKPVWLKEEYVRILIPMLLAGKWNASYEEGDCKIVEKLAGMDYRVYLQELGKLAVLPDSPVINVDRFWRLTSPMDAWINMASWLIANDYERLKEVALLVLAETDPEIVEREANSSEIFICKEKTKYSRKLKEGILQSLVLIAVYGKKLKFKVAGDCEIWVDSIIGKLLQNEDLYFWKSLDRCFPLIAEAAPARFLSVLERNIKQPEWLKQMFVVTKEPYGFGPIIYFTGILWGLEGLAWEPRYLSRVCLILLRMSSVSLPENVGNRPWNSLRHIFMFWCHQTFATFEDRKKVLELLAATDPDISWQLLVKLIPQDHEIGGCHHTMRWRMFGRVKENTYDVSEVIEGCSHVIGLLLQICHNKAFQIKDLLDISVRTKADNRSCIIGYLENNKTKIPASDYEYLRSCLRTILSRHRSYADTDWALPEKELIKYESLYLFFEPVDIVEKHRWLFETYDIEPIEFAKEQDDDKREELQAKFRERALLEIYREKGIQAIIALGKEVKFPGFVGEAFGAILPEEEVESFVALPEAKDLDEVFYTAFWRRLMCVKAREYVELVMELYRRGVALKIIGNLFLCLFPDRQLWNRLDQSDLGNWYWTHMHSSFSNLELEDVVYGLKQLMKKGRYSFAIRIASRSKGSLPFLLIVGLLSGFAGADNQEPRDSSYHAVEKLFEKLDQHPDVNAAEMIRLELLYINVLTEYHAFRSPVFIYRDLITHPESFMEIVRWTYMPEHFNGDKEQLWAGQDRQMVENKALIGWKLLRNIDVLPGVLEDGSMDREQLNNWIDQVRQFALAEDRVKSVDDCIGRMLAQYPRGEGPYPPEEICEVIERIGSDDVCSGYSIALQNKGGVTVRSPYAGGVIERERAESYLKLADQHRNKYPWIAAIFEDIASTYTEFGRLEDIEARLSALEY